MVFISAHGFFSFFLDIYDEEIFFKQDIQKGRRTIHHFDGAFYHMRIHHERFFLPGVIVGMSNRDSCGSRHLLNVDLTDKKYEIPAYGGDFSINNAPGTFLLFNHSKRLGLHLF